MFLHMSVIHFVHRQGVSVHYVTSCLWSEEGGFFVCRGRGVSVRRGDFCQDPYPRTVDEWAVCILLECFFVLFAESLVADLHSKRFNARPPIPVHFAK